MSRPHIEFIQCQAVSWRTLGPESARRGVDAKALSRDADSKAVSAILRYPKGWELSGAHHLDSDEELFVLKGSLSVGNLTYGQGDYAYLPAGYLRDGMAAPDGADVLTFFEGPHARIDGPAADGVYDARKLVERIASHDVEWGSATDPKVKAPGVRRLGLRKDPETGDTTWLLDIDETGMGGDVNRLETHPVVEEVFLLSGEMHMPMGVLKQGAYFWRPPGIPHGPVGTKTGALGFFRCKGGPLTTEWSEDAYPVTWNAAYDPFLPEDVAQRLATTYDESLPY